jgi:hypothetical protein
LTCGLASTACIGLGKIALSLSRGSSKGRKKPTLVLEARADQELWIWHAISAIPVR